MNTCIFLEWRILYIMYERKNKNVHVIQIPEHFYICTYPKPVVSERKFTRPMFFKGTNSGR